MTSPNISITGSSAPGVQKTSQTFLNHGAQTKVTTSVITPLPVTAHHSVDRYTSHMHQKIDNTHCHPAGLSAAKPGLQALLEGFQARQPELVQQVKQMMVELENISVLSIEQRHITLLDVQVTQLYFDIQMCPLCAFACDAPQRRLPFFLLFFCQ